MIQISIIIGAEYEEEVNCFIIERESKKTDLWKFDKRTRRVDRKKNKREKKHAQRQTLNNRFVIYKTESMLILYLSTDH